MTSPSAAEVRGSVPDRIWITINGQRTSYPAGASYLIGGWEAVPNKPHAVEYVPASALDTATAEIERLRALSDRLKLEAQAHAQEARTANSTIYEIYQVLSGSTGEPGNWNGAEPARQFVAAARERIAELEGDNTRIKKALKPFADTFRRHNDPGVSDLYNDQPVAWHVPLYAYRAAATLSPAVKETK